MAVYNVDTDGVSRTYATLAAALAALPATFTEDNYIHLYASTGAADTTAPGTLAFNTTTDYRLYVVGHAGYVFAPSGSTRWTMAPSSNTYYGNITVQGVSFEKTGMSANYQSIVQVSTYRNGQIRFLGNRFLGQDIGGTYRDRLIDINIDPTYSATIVIANNVIIGRSTAVSAANNLIYSTLAGNTYIYANTLKGYMSNNANANAVWKDNAIKTTNAPAAVNAESDYNMFSGAFTFGGTNDEQGRTFVFVDEAGFDFHLASSDTGAMDAGTSLSSDAHYVLTTDADGVTRADPPDCGAFELSESSSISGDVSQDSGASDLSASGSIAGSAEGISGSVTQEAVSSSHAATGTVTTPSKIIIDHTAVDKYAYIPESHKTAIKQKWISVPGESHAGGYRAGLNYLEAIDASFAVNVTTEGTPEMPTSDHLRASGATWGDVTHATLWRYYYGEEDWFTNAAALAQTKVFLQYAHDQGFGLSAVGFGWCWDMSWHHTTPTVAKDPVYKCGWCGASELGPEGDLAWGLDAADTAVTGNSVCMDSYLNATREYIAYCDAHGISTKVFFTTGPVDGYSGENGYQRHVKHEYIRNDVNLNGGILFDYADIEAWDNAGSQNLQSWTDGDGVAHPYQMIAADNLLNFDGTDGSGTTGYHIGERGALRLGKAIWVMLAMMDGWDGVVGPVGGITQESPPSDQEATGYLIDPLQGAVDQVSSISIQDVLGAIEYTVDLAVEQEGSPSSQNVFGEILYVIDMITHIEGIPGDQSGTGAVADPLLDIYGIISQEGASSDQDIVGYVQQVPSALIEVDIEEGPQFIVSITEEGSNVSASSPIILDSIEELSTKAVVVSFSYLSGGVSVDATPKTLTWSLRNLNDEIVNSRENVPILVIGTSITIVLSGEDLNIDGSGELRKLVIRGTYDSGLGDDLPFTKEIRFPVLKVSGL